MPKNVTIDPIYRQGDIEEDYYFRLTKGKNVPTPLDVAVAKIDKYCPRCGAQTYWPIIVHFDLGKKTNGEYFGALCHRCRWAF